MRTRYAVRPRNGVLRVLPIAFLLLVVSTARSATDARLEGVWRTEGYGRVVEIKGSAVSIFDVTKISCIMTETQPLDHFLRDIDRVNLTEKNRVSYYRQGEITRYSHTRLDTLSDACATAKNSKGPNLDPQYNFDVFWHSFNENYAFFGTRKVDWDAVYRQYRPRINESTSSEELYDVMSTVIRILDDGHVTLQAEGLPARGSGQPGTLQKMLNVQPDEGEQAIARKMAEAAKSVIAAAYPGANQKRAAGGRLAWGWAADGIGYLSIDSMAGYGARPDAPLRDTLRYVDETIDQVISDLAGARGFIVDARWNSGGYDTIALHIAGHFTDQVLLAFTKNARDGDRLTPPQEVFIPGHARNRFVGPVVYLCAKDTVSAAEIFSMAMMAMPNVTSLGEQTYGALSDMHRIQLPNGWHLSMSNEVYTASDGVVYEGSGIPVDIHLAPGEKATLDSYVKAGVQEAIAVLARSNAK